MTDGTRREHLMELPLDVLYNKLRLGQLLTRMLEKETDPRAPAAVVRLQEQCAFVAQVLAEREAAEGPPSQVIGMQSIEMAAKVGGRNG